MFEIDAVYTWVDGNDPVWQAKRNVTLKKFNLTESRSKDNETCRYRNNEELKYSLRSLALYAPWIRRVHLLTDDQYPPWLNSEAVHLVHHKDIFPPQMSYPSFNSRAIELAIPYIPDLSEHFIYFNDDFMLGAPNRPSDFFSHDGKPNIWLRKRSKRYWRRYLNSRSDQSDSYTESMKYVYRLIAEAAKIHVPYKSPHVPLPMTKFFLEKIYTDFGPEIEKTMQSQFRSTEEVVITRLFPLYAIASGYANLTQLNGLNCIIDMMSKRIKHIGVSMGDDNFYRKLSLIVKLRPLTFCINDSRHTTDDHLKAFVALMQELFPRPSKFEIQA